MIELGISFVILLGFGYLWTLHREKSHTHDYKTEDGMFHSGCIVRENGEIHNFVNNSLDTDR